MKKKVKYKIPDEVLMAVKATERKRSDLKPCPFCGDTVTSRVGPLGTTMFVCPMCGADVCFYGAEEGEKADRAWNRRPE